MLRSGVWIDMEIIHLNLHLIHEDTPIQKIELSGVADTDYMPKVAVMPNAIMKQRITAPMIWASASAARKIHWESEGGVNYETLSW